MPTCFNGTEIDEACFNGDPVDTVCFNGDEVFPNTGATPITADFTYAPSPDNLGGADPTVGTLSELLDAPQGTIGEELNKGIYAVVSNIQGGDGGLYSVDFSGLSWSFDQQIVGIGPVDFSATVEENWALNQHLFSTSAAGMASTPTVAGTTSGAAPVGAVVSGVAAGTDFASYIPQVRSDGTNTAQTLEFTHTMGAGTVTVSDGSGNTLVLSAPLRTDSWQRPGNAPPP